MIKYEPNSSQQVTPPIINLRCPLCRRNGAFAGVLNIPDALIGIHMKGPPGQSMMVRHANMGLRLCPNTECRGLIFVVVDQGKVTSFPAERLDFEPTGIPQKIIESFEEAITNHANRCFKSAAIMVRRTLEEICADKGASGKDLKDRLKALQSVIIVPKELLDAADELRILGNDAAHLEAKVYDDVGQPEVEAAIDLCKELLKAVYQLDSLVQRLRNLKKSP